MSEEFCPECGAKITGNTGFCSECGAVTTSLQNSIEEAKIAKFEAEKRRKEKQKKDVEKAKRKLKKNIHWVILAFILLILLINANNILALMFPQDTSIDINVEETPYIRGGIVHLTVLDSNGSTFSSNEKLNVTMIDEKGNNGTVSLKLGYPSSVSIYRYGGSHDDVWKDLSVYGNYTIIVQYPGELGYKPCNITKNITINPKEVPK